jgi:sulfhydrogenase subunit beta (sulfur reductase)
MLPQTLSKTQFASFVEYLMMDDNRLMAPVARGDQFGGGAGGIYAFREITSAAEIGSIRMDYDITILPPKKFFHPQHETLLEFTGPGPEGARQTVGGAATVILGAHPYDLHGIATLDAAFSQPPADANYLNRRASARLIGMNISGYVNEHQFMADMGTLEPPAGGCDLFLTDLGDSYFVEVGTPAGVAMAKSSGLLRPAGPQEHKAKQEFDEKKAAAFPKRLPYRAQYLPELLDASYDSLLWDAISRRCFSCGTCTNVCPTCYCFDVQDKLNLDARGGCRRRQWDSCQLRTFAEVAGGENFREHRASRARHRMFRKGKYILARTGETGCVGCGRCSHHCVAKISILEAFQQIAGEAAELGI